MALALSLGGCASPSPEPGPDEPTESTPAFEGVLGEDWVELVPADEALNHVYALWGGFGQLWALSDSGHDTTDTLLVSSNGSDWAEVALDPRLPDDLDPPVSWWPDDDRIVLAFTEYTDPHHTVPWLAVYDGTDWAFHGPDQFGQPTARGSLALRTYVIQAVAPVGDSLLLLVDASWYDGGMSTIPCACNAPLVLHPDGTSEWVAVQGGPLGQLDSFGGLDHLIPVDDGVLLVTSWLDDDTDGNARIHVFHSSNGIDWTERVGPNNSATGVGELAAVVRSGDAWVTGSYVRDRAADTKTVVLLSSADGVDWQPTFRSQDGEYRDLHSIIATYSGFWAFPVSALDNEGGTDVLHSVDGLNWTVHDGALRAEYTSASPQVLAATAVGGGIVALAHRSSYSLYLSGPTGLAP